MSVCTTCLKPGIAASGHDCPGFGEVQLSRQLGRGIIVDTAPARARMSLAVLVNAGWGAVLQDNDLANIADQVLYQVTGYDPESASLVLELVEDWRPVPAVKLTEAEVEEIKARWQARYGKPGTAHPVVELREDDPPVQCWHTEPGTPCDWDICRRPERTAAGDRGTDPAHDSAAVDPLPRPLSEHCRPGRCLGLMCCSYECSRGRCPSIPAEFRESTP